MSTHMQVHKKRHPSGEIGRAIECNRDLVLLPGDPGLTSAWSRVTCPDCAKLMLIELQDRMRYLEFVIEECLPQQRSECE